MRFLSRNRLLSAACILLLGFGLVFFIWLELGDWPDPVSQGRVAQADLIVVLGGGAMERPRKAAELYRDGVAPMILVTGDGDFIYNELRSMRIPSSDIIHETMAHSTWENAVFSGKFPVFQRAQRIVLVTSWFHGARAEAVFRKLNPLKTFLVAAEPPHYPLDSWARSYRRRERYAIVYYEIFHGITLRHRNASDGNGF